jgi:hypothetical protein
MVFTYICYWIAVLFGVKSSLKRNYPYLLVPEKYVVVSEFQPVVNIRNIETGDNYVYIKPTKEILLSVHWYKDMTFLERCVLTTFLYDEVLVHK